MSASEKTPRAKVILLYNFKGGAGKSTSTVGLAGAAIHAGVSVGVADCNDVQGSLDSWLKNRKANGLTPTIHGGIIEPEKLQEFAERAGKGGAKLLLVDCPPSYNAEHESHLLSAADYVVVPSFIDGEDIRVLHKTFGVIKSHPRFKVADHPPVGLLPILHTTNKKCSELPLLRTDLHAIARKYSVPVFSEEIPFSFAQRSEATAFGKTFMETKTRSIGNAYRSVFSDIISTLDR